MYYLVEYSNAVININLLDTVVVCPGSIIPLFGRTQYLFGAVVFTLKHTFPLDGFVSLNSDVTTSVNGPIKKIHKC